MRILIIVAREYMSDELEELLLNNGITAYTMLNKLTGKGKAGRVSETVFGESNMLIFAVLSFDQVPKVVDALKTFLTARAKSAHGHPIPLKVFCSPCEELI